MLACPVECKEKHLACNYSIPGVCCHPECIGGCSGPTNVDCYACRNVHFKNQCISECPPNYYQVGAGKKSLAVVSTLFLNVISQVLNRRCITKEDCHSRKAVLDENNEEVYYKALDVTGTCEMKCPENYEENPLNKRECIKCPVGIGCTKSKFKF